MRSLREVNARTEVHVRLPLDDKILCWVPIPEVVCRV